MKLIKKQISNLTYFSIDNLSISLDVSKRYNINLWSEGTQKQGNYTKTLYFDDTLEEWRMRDCECSNKDKSLNFSIVIENNVLKSLETLKIYGIDNGGVHIFNEVYFELNESEGTTDYTELENQPSINDVVLIGNKTTSDLDIELKINTDFTTYTPGTTAPRITPDDFGRIIASKCAINLVVSTNDETNKTSTFKVIYKSTSGYNNKLSFIIKGIVDNVEKTYFYYMPDNSTVAVRIMEYADQIEFNAVKNSYIKDIAWNNANLFITYGDDSTQSIMRNAHIYRHYYTMRPTSAFAYETISFTIDLPTPTPLTTNTLRAWFTASPFWDTNGNNYIGKPLYPCSGMAALNNSIPAVANGLCYYVEQDGMLINVTLYAYCNYGARYSIDESTLHCSGVYNLTNGERVL